MQKLFDCIVYLHDPFILSLAVLTLVIGSVVTMRLFARARRTERDIRKLWLILAGLIGGGTIWSTHFLSMLAYESDFILGYEPVLTVTSLIIVICTTTLGFVLAANTQQSIMIEIGGGLMGLGVAIMHYLGTYAMQIHGTINWDIPFVISSIVFGVLFGAIATSRIARPVTFFCQYGASVSLIVAVASMHFISMAGMAIYPANGNIMDGELISETMLGGGIFTLMTALYLVTYLMSLIDTKSNQASTETHKKLEHQDPLTGIPNRLGCFQHLKSLLSSTMNDISSVAVVKIDIDRFKMINDLHGHAAGDHLLRTISERITAQLKEDELIGRSSGDEFIAIKSNIFNKRDAKEFSKQIADAISKPISWNDDTIATTASIGYSIFPQDGNLPAELIDHAELAMKTAKTQSKSKIVSYHNSMNADKKRHNALSVDLAKAIENNEFELHYQLQNDTQSRVITGVEALLRWHHPVHGNVSPAVFIPIAEKTDFIIEIGNWVLEKACKQASNWKKPIKVAVNVASRQLTDPRFPEFVANILSQTGLPPERLELEITESGIIADISQALQIIKGLKKLGIRVAMDDYGTGYSSLSTLQSFPFDKIKIDREFIKEINTNKQSSAIVQSTIILGNSLDIPVLAEGVETEAHLKLLNQHGCQQVQGYLFGKPMPNSELEDVFADQHNFTPRVKAA